MKRSPIAALVLTLFAGIALGQDAPKVKEVFVPSLNHKVKLHNREQFKQRAIANARSYHLPSDPGSAALPIDNTGKQSVKAPILGNDQYGDCGPAMCAHQVGIYTYGTGLPGWNEWLPDLDKLISQYLAVSGGDNGTNEQMLVGPNGIFRTGLAGDPTAIVVDSLDIDATNTAVVQHALSNGFLVSMAWSVPDAFIQNFATGVLFASPGIPDPNNGHYTPLADVDAKGNYSLWTWGSYCWVSQGFVDSVQPQSFVVFSPRAFNPKTGLDAKGRHITTQAAAWRASGGREIPASVIASFPPAPKPKPVPPPDPVPAPKPGPCPDATLGFNWAALISGIISAIVAGFGGFAFGSYRLRKFG